MEPLLFIPQLLSFSSNGVVLDVSLAIMASLTARIPTPPRIVMDALVWLRLDIPMGRNMPGVCTAVDSADSDVVWNIRLARDVSVVTEVSSACVGTARHFLGPPSV